MAGSLLDALRDPILVLALQGTVSELNTAARKWLGVGDGTGQALGTLCSNPDELLDSASGAGAVCIGKWRTVGGRCVQAETHVRLLRGHTETQVVVHIAGHARAAEKETAWGPVFQSTREGVLVVAATGGVVAANEAACQLFGRADLAGTDVRDLFPGASRDARWAQIRALMQQERSRGSGAAHRQERRMQGLRGDGTVGGLSVLVSSLAPSDGVEGCLYLLHVQDTSQSDISSAKQAQLLASNRLLWATGVAVIGVDPQGIVVSANPAAASMLGHVGPADLVGVGVGAILSDECVTQCLPPLVRTETDRWTANGRYVARRRDGGRLPVDVCVSQAEGEGEVMYAVTLCDATLATHTEKEVESERQQKVLLQYQKEALLASSMDAVLLITDKGVIEEYNRAAERMFGYSASEVVGQNVSLLMPQELGNLHQGYIDRHVTNQTTGAARPVGRKRKLVGVRRDGSRLPIVLNVADVQVLGQGPRSFVSCIRDVTDYDKVLADLECKTQEIEAILHSIGDGLVVVDEGGTIMSFNGAASRMFGYTQEEAVGMGVEQLVPEHMAEQHTTFMQRFMDSGDKAMGRLMGRGRQVKARRRDGSTFPCVITLSEVQGGLRSAVAAGAEPRRLFTASVRDVSDKMAADSALQAEKQLGAERTARMEAIFSSALDAIVMIDEQGVVLEFNNAAVNLFGWRADEVVGQPVAMLMPDDVGRIHQAYIDRYLRSGEKAKGRAVGKKRKLMGRCRDGRLFPMTLSLSEVVPEGGGESPRHFVGVIRDTSEAERLVSELDAKTLRLEAILNSVAEAVVVLNGTGTILSLNASAVRIFGFSLEEVEGRDVAILMSPELQNVWRTFLDRYVPTSPRGTPGYVLARGQVVQGRRRDGSFFPAIYTLSEAIGVLGGSAPLDPAATRQFVMSVRDLTEKLRVEAALESERVSSLEKTRRMAAIFSCANDAVIMMDQRGKILEFNRAAEKTFGWRADEILGQDVSRLMPEHIGRMHQSYVDRYLKSGEMASARAVGRNRKLHGQHQDGHIFPITLSLSEVEGAPDGDRQFVGVIRDLTETERLAADLQAKTQQAEAILNSVADAIVALSSDAKIVAFNRTATVLFGCTVEEALGRPLGDLLAGNSTQLLSDIIQWLGGSTGPDPTPRPAMGRRKNGGVFPLTVAMGDSQQIGLSTRVYTVCLRDQTEKAEAEAALHSERKVSLDKSNHMEAIFSSALDGIIVIDERGLVRNFNTAAERLFGWRADEVVGQPVAMLMPEHIGRVHQTYIDRYLRSGEKAHGRAVGRNRKLQGRRKDGTYFSMTLSLSEVAGASTRCFVGFIRDLSELERLMEELEHKSSHIEAIFNSTVDAMVTCDQHSRISAFNTAAERMFGWPRQEALGQNIAVLMEEKFGQLHQQYMDQYIGKGDTAIGQILGRGRQLVGRRRDGELFPILVTLSEVRHNLPGKEREFTASMRDLSELKRIATDLQTERSDNSKMRMAGNLMMHCLAAITTDGQDPDMSVHATAAQALREGTPLVGSPPPSAMHIQRSGSISNMSGGCVFAPRPQPMSPTLSSSSLAGWRPSDHGVKRSYSADSSPLAEPHPKRPHVELDRASPLAASRTPSMPAVSRTPSGPLQPPVARDRSPASWASSPGPRCPVSHDLTAANSMQSLAPSNDRTPPQTHHMLRPNRADGGRMSFSEFPPTQRGSVSEGPGSIGLLDLPFDLQARILLRLPQYTLLQCRQVCRQMAAVLAKLPLDWAMQPRPMARRLAAVLAAFPRMHTIRLTRDTVSRECMQGLSRLTELQSLDMAFCQVQGPALLALSALASLAIIDLKGNEVGATTRGLAALTNLATVNLTSCNVPDQGLSFLSALKSMRHLHLGGCPITDDGMGQLTHLEALRELDLADTGVSAKGIAMLSGLSHLRVLNLSGGCLDDEGARALCGLSTLHVLTADYCHGLTDEGVKALAQCTALKSLSLVDAALTEEGLEALRELGQLSRLVLSVEGQEPWLRDDGLGVIGQISGLKTLVAAGQEAITDEGVCALKGLGLANLDLSYSQVTGVGLGVLAGMPALRIVELYGCQVSQQDQEGFAERLPGCRLSV